MKTYYAVTAGDYSEYHIVAITDNKETAERIMDLYNRRNKWSTADIEEYREAMPDNKNYYFVVFPSGREPYASIYLETNMDDEPDINVVDDSYGKGYAVLVIAKDADHAIKIASDLVAQHKAEKEGIC